MGWNPFKAIGDLFEEVVSWFIDIPESNRGVEINRSSRNDPIPIVYGRDKVKGANWAYWSTSGKDNRYLYIWAAFSEGEIDGFEEIWIDDKPLAEFASVRRETYPNFTAPLGDDIIVIREYLGADDQTSDSMLQAADSRWTANHRLRGIAGLVLRFRWSDKYFSGLPQVSAVVRGKKVLLADNSSIGWTENAALVLRDYLTSERYGKGLAWPDDINVASWQQAFTDCEDTETFFTPQALGVPDEVGVIGGESVLRWDSRPADAVALAGATITGAAGGSAASRFGFMSAGYYGKNGGYYLPYDNVVTDFQPGESITISQPNGKLFSFNGTLNGGSDPDTVLDNVKTIRAVMRGNMPQIQGAFHLYVEKARAPVATIEERDIYGGIEWSAPKKGDKYNRVTVKFINPSAEWKEDLAIWPDPGSPEEAQFLVEDNGTPLHKELTIEGIRNAYQAKDIARVICLKSRDNIQVSLTADPWLLGYHCGQVIALNWSGTGWVDKPFLITQRGLTEHGNVMLGLEEHTAAIYDYAPDVLDRIKDNTTLPDPFTVPVPSNFTTDTILVRLEEKRPSQIGIYIDVEFDRVDDAFVREYQVRTRQVERFDLQAGQWVPDIGSYTEHPKYDQVDESEARVAYFAPVTTWLRRYEVEARCINDAGVVGDWSQPLVHEVFLDTTAPEPPVITKLVPAGRSIAVTLIPDNDPDYAYAKVYVNTANDFGTAVVGIEELNGTDGVVAGLQPETVYYIWATSVDDVGNESGPSTVASTTTTEPDTPPYVESPTEPDPGGYGEGAYWFNPTTGEVKRIEGGAWVAFTPDPPTNLRLTNPDPADDTKFKGREAKFDWKGPENLPFFWYDIEIWPSYPRDTPARKLRSEDRGGPASARFFQWTFQDAIDADPGGTLDAPEIKNGSRTFEVRVYTIFPDEVTRSATAATLTVTNDQLQQITGFEATAVDRSIEITHAPIEGSDFAGIEVHGSTSAGFTPSESTLLRTIYAGGDRQEIRTLLSGQGVRYLKLLGFDVWGKERNLMTPSAEVAVTLPSNFGGLAYRGDVGSGEILDNAVVRAKVPAGELVQTTFVTFAPQISDPAPSFGEMTSSAVFVAEASGIISFVSKVDFEIGGDSITYDNAPRVTYVLSLRVNGGTRIDLTGFGPFALFLEENIQPSPTAQTASGTAGLQATTESGSAPPTINPGDSVEVILRVGWFAHTGGFEFVSIENQELTIVEYNNT